MVKKIIRLLRKTHVLIMIFVSLFISLGMISFFYFRSQHINNICTQSILEEFKSEEWGAGKKLNPEQVENLNSLKLIYLHQQHRQCVEDAKFFYLF